MGIMVVYMANDHGPDPFTDPPDVEGAVTHGHLAANDNHGGEPSGTPDPASLPDGATLDDQVGIGGFTYLPGNLGSAGPFGDPPIVHRGHSLVFGNLDAASQIFHTITACQSPCTGSTGISYPLANGPIDFDSGDLGYGPTGFTAAANRAQWKTPATLPLGTYTYFCRIHPYMRGAFRVVR
jgi:hypothetical protein